MSYQNKKTALIVEDSPTQLLILECLLSMNGLDTICATDGKEGLHCAQLHLPDIIVLDVQLPGINGLQLCEILKENKHTRSIPIILLTSMNYTEIAKFGFRADEVKHIPKDEYANQALLEALYTKGLIDEINLITL
jgi:CheY-like chemotaxis protein